MTRLDVEALAAAYERAELACAEAAEGERAAWDGWQAALGAFELRRDESEAARRRYRAATAA